MPNHTLRAHLAPALLLALCGCAAEAPYSAPKRSATAQPARTEFRAVSREGDRASEVPGRAVTPVEVHVPEAIRPAPGQAPASQPAPRRQAAAPAPIDPPGTIILDGDTRDWPAATVALSNSHHGFIRFKVADGPYTLQAADRTTSIMLDADNDAGTGRRVTLGGDTLGVDVEAQFSPVGENGRRGRGVAIIGYEPDADAFRLSTYDWDFACTPTYASDWYEARFSRAPRGTVPCVTKGLLSSGTSRGAVATLDSAGAPDAYSPVFVIENQPVAPDARADATIPEKPDSAVRVVSYNVLRSSPNAKPQVFQRILGALQPDIVLVQEWEAASYSEIADWFNSMLPAPQTWHVAAIADTVQNGGGVAVISRFPLRPVLDQRPTVPEGATNAGKPIRAAMALADAPGGPIVLCSAHLKSGGAMGSPEDVRRVEEARALNALITSKTPRGAWRVIAGDMNLVGSREPLEVLMARLDADQTDLAAAPTRTLGDAAYLTWGEHGNAFAPGRLDWLLFSDSTAHAANAFVLDTSRLTDAALARAGLTATDTADATDHMPVVVDLVPAR